MANAAVLSEHRCLVVASLLLGLTLVAAPAAAQCSRDTDCKGDRICTRGECVTATPAPAVVVAPPARLDYERPPRNILSTNPLGIIGGSVGLEYEHVFSRWFSLAVGVSYYDSKMNPFASADVAVTGGLVTVQPRFYLLRRGAPRGLYLSPVVSVGYVSATGTDYDGWDVSLGGVGYSVGGLVGWSWLIGRHFNIKLGAGARYDHYVLSDGVDTYGVSGPAFLGELSFGWAF